MKKAIVFLMVLGVFTFNVFTEEVANTLVTFSFSSDNLADQNFAFIDSTVTVDSMADARDAENDVDILATVEQGQGEVLEIAVISEFNNKRIMDIHMPALAVIGVIQRNNSIVIPKGDTTIYTNDTLIIFTKAESAKSIKEFFKVK